ncbi:MAG: transposase [Polyangiaceae bacterium]
MPQIVTRLGGAPRNTLEFSGTTELVIRRQVLVSAKTSDSRHSRRRFNSRRLHSVFCSQSRCFDPRRAPLQSGCRSHRVMQPVQFLARLAALIPPPRHPLVRFYGVFAPHAS